MKTPGQIAYEAFSEGLVGFGPWEDVTEDRMACWEAAARAVQPTVPDDLREAVARIIDPDAFKPKDEVHLYYRLGQDKLQASALAQADAILTLIAGREAGLREALKNLASDAGGGDTPVSAPASTEDHAARVGVSSAWGVRVGEDPQPPDHPSTLHAQGEASGGGCVRVGSFCQMCGYRACMRPNPPAPDGEG